MTTSVKTNEFDCDYYENGLVTGKSCYINYRWMPELTIRMAYFIIRHLGLKDHDSILDYGCAKGYLVKALRLLNVDAYGSDISEYAINQAEADTRAYCALIESAEKTIPFDKEFDWIMSKDVMEHMTEEDIDKFLSEAYQKTKRMFHVVPLGDGEKYVIPEYQLDKTHIQANSKEWWLNKFASHGWGLESFHYDLEGIKDNWTDKYPEGNGFFLLKRI